MNWLPYSLLALLLLSLVGVNDKVLIERRFPDGWSFTFFVSLFLGGYSTLLLLVRGSLGLFRLPALPVLVIALLPGFLQYLSSLCNTRALLRADVSIVAALNQMTTLFAVVWGWTFFNNTFSPVTYIGLITIVVCCMQLGMSQAPSPHHLKLDPVIWLVLVGALLRSIGDLSVKLTLTAQDQWNTLVLSHAAQLPIALVMLSVRSHRKILASAVRRNGIRIVPLMAMYEALVLVPQLLSVTAYSQGPLALVSAILYSKPLFVLLITVLVNRLSPGFVPERGNGQSLVRRATWILGVLAGALMLRG